MTSITLPENAFAASADSSVRKAQSAAEKQKYETGILWYHHALYQLDGQDKTGYKSYIHYNLSKLYYAEGKYSNSIRHIRESIRFNTSEQNDPVLRYHLGRSLIVNHEHATGELQLLRSRMAAEDPVLKLHITLYLARLYGYLNDLYQMAYYLNQAKELQLELPDTIDEHLAEAGSYAGMEPVYKSENKAKVLSTAIPGAGQLYARQYTNALGAVMVNSATIALLVRSVTLENYHHTLLIGSLLWWRYYDGNRDNAAHSVHEYNNRQRQSAIRKAMQSLDEIYRESFMQGDISLKRDDFLGAE
ncbi:hypothetical protein [Natronogracilivirga saccharolytica]|uniref:Tetratricopeptide repeat protein n=1 Tax=Natronogracilivirga saccharolytica TaxID=2812953 RepID=A0A8J7S4L4_9BACT|nr:hypothetical protein [Natronogracilivirga saccharolytica]MBP3191878.1 hypothetical protein [Natronogracilivirga saccharolytica]